MARDSVDEWSTTAAENTVIADIGIQGTNKPSNFDGAFRESMAQVKSKFDELAAHIPYFSVYNYGATGDGSTDDRTALFDANAAAAAAGAGLVIEPGTFLVNSALTLSVPVKFAGGKLKPANGVTVTFSNEILASPRQIFDTSLGGTIAGSPKLPSNSAWAEWWGANPVGDCTTGILAAVAFIKQRVISGSTGGILQLEQGDYGISSTITVDFRACKIVGRGDWLTRLYGVGGILMFDVVGHIDGSKASYGFALTECSVAGDNTNPKPTAGKIMKLFEVQQFTIEQNTFLNIYQGIEFESCEGPLEKQMSRNTWISPNTKPAIGGSYLWYIKGVSAATPGVTTGICHNIHMLSNRGGGIGIQNGGVMDGFDQIKSVANHWWGCDVACLHITSNGQDGYNFFSVGDTYEAINGGAAYAVLVSSSQVNNLNALTFSAGQALNGSNTMILITGTAPENITFSSYDLRQTIGNTILLENGTDLRFIDCSAIDININADGGGHTYCIVGNGGVGPTGVTLTDFNTAASDFAGVASYSIDLRVGEQIQINGGRLRNSSFPIIMAAALHDEVLIGDTVDTGLRIPTIASATSISPGLGCGDFHVSGTTNIQTIGQAYSHRGRNLALRLDSAAVVEHGTGNIALNPASNWTPTAGSWLFLRYMPEMSKWIETGRQVA